MLPLPTPQKLLSQIVPNDQKLPGTKINAICIAWAHCLSEPSSVCPLTLDSPVLLVQGHVIFPASTSAHTSNHPPSSSPLLFPPRLP